MSLPMRDLALPHHNSNTAGTTVASDLDRRSDGGEWMSHLSASGPEKPEKGQRMNPLKVSAMFAAYVWFTRHNEGAPTADTQTR